jgi:outer membrane receptor for ferrienterochelin and colicins
MKWQYSGKNKVTLAVRPFREDRWGGEMGWTTADRGGAEVYGESILTERIEATSQVVFGSNVLCEGSWVHHNQDSYYGTTWYKAIQQTGYLHLAKSITRAKHLLRIGTTQRIHEYSDNSSANTDELRWIPGVYLQDEWKYSEKWTVLSGLRLDIHGEHGSVWAPQLNVKFAPGDRTTMRLNAGSGFRLVNLFAEDHAALTGSRTVRIDEDLNPERSYTTSVDLMHISNLGGRSFGRWILNGFYTVFGNKILPDYNTDPDLIIYRNLDGKGIVRGVSFDAQIQIRRSFRLAAGVTWMEAFEQEDPATIVPQLFTPAWSGNGSVTWIPAKGWEFTWMMKWTGPMELPRFDEPYQRPSRSRAFALCHAQIRRQFKEGCNVFIAAKNLLNYTQDSPLIRPDQPFSEEFDTSYAYGPLQVRHLVVGVNWMITRKKVSPKNPEE